MTTAVSLLGIQIQFKIFHWQTHSFAKHNGYGGIYDALDDLIDKFVEVSMGKYGRIVVESDDVIKLSNIGEVNMIEYLDNLVEFLLAFNNQLNSARDSDLLNIRDEMLAEVNKLKYLLTLK